ncbi:cytochrome c [Rhodocyclaceae bacterium]
MFIRLLLPLAFALGLAACDKPPEDTRPGQPVKTRQTAFKEMLRVFEPMGTMLRDGKYDAGKFEAMAAALIAKRDGPWTHFGPDTHYPPTKAKPEVWEKAAEFEAARAGFFKSTDALLSAAQSKELKGVEDAYARVYDDCQSCHDAFKKK